MPDDDLIDGCTMGDLGVLAVDDEQAFWLPLFCAVDWRYDRPAVLAKAREWRELFGGGD